MIEIISTEEDFPMKSLELSALISKYKWCKYGTADSINKILRLTDEGTNINDLTLMIWTLSGRVSKEEIKNVLEAAVRSKYGV